ncbi:MAG: SprT-like domain-containing protein [Thermoanaerobaculia bacterium]|nr:SprT-like domain-containing protein [Thermoanaerobaculia bacterium]
MAQNHADLTIELITALTNVWGRIRQRHPEVPPVILIPAPAERGRGNVLGHFAPVRWQAKRNENIAIHEVVVVAEHLDRTAEAVTETLLHEAAHALDFARGIRDCSRSQYHNGYFKAAAEELGLVVAQVPNYGYAYTQLPVETVRLYEAEIRALDEVLLHRRKPRAPPPNGGGDKDTHGKEDNDDAPDEPKGRLRKATCACPFIIRVAKRTIAHTTIRCESCGEPFTIA